MSAWRERAVLGMYAVAWRSVRLLPEIVAYRVFDVFADVAWWRRGRGVRQLEANLRRARPTAGPAELRALSRAGMRSYSRYWCDSFRLPDWTPERIEATVRVIGAEPVQEVLDGGRGAVVFLGHLGNWDHAGAWSGLRLAPVTTVAERLRPQELFDRFVAYRERLGIRILPAGAGGETFRDLIRTVRGGGFVPLVSDRALGGSGVVVDLLGHPARLAAGPAALALSTGAALYVASVHYERLSQSKASRHGIVIAFTPVEVADLDRRSPDAVVAVTQRCADVLSAAIAEHPQDWHMLQRVFEADPPAHLSPAGTAPGRTSSGRTPPGSAGAVAAGGGG
ncbi:MAG: phosphatidylinositol mannoside acyltransferase [Angustibacter sp.]